MYRSFVLAAASLLAACAQAPDVAPDRRTAAERWVIKEQLPLSTKPIGIWYANRDPNSMICGEIEAPAQLQGDHPTLRYVFDDQHSKRPVAQVEMHRGWIGTGMATDALLEQNRRIFDAMWNEHCARAAPLRRRLGLDRLGLVTEQPRDRGAEEISAEMRDREAATRKIARDLREALRE